jgi:hypothetical protein
MEKIEMLARMWIACDPNRGGTDPDEIIGQRESSSTGGESTAVDTPLTGKPTWNWFLPRAEATEEFLREHGWQIVKITS